jgi:nitroimidazol reductase NimA-like FMN-containing flavoprotein (pyridoxamine 5'-phosphate oxidase superfamily)
MTTDGAEKGSAGTVEEDPRAAQKLIGEEGFDEIPSEDCMRLLREGAVGLLALIGTESPDVRPVNFALYRRQIMMRTGRGHIFDSACREEPASFVITESDRLEHSGWSVVVKGRLSICDPSDSAIHTRVRAWAKADKREWVKLSIDRVTGRRISREAG